MNIEINNKIQNSYISRIFTYSHSSMHKIMQLTLPVLGMIALSYIPIAKAGQTEYDLCVATCPEMAKAAEVISMGSIPYEYALRACEISCSYNLLF